MKELFNLIKNKDDVYIEPIKYSGDKLSEKMKEIPQYLPKKNFSIYICGLPKSGKSTIIHSLLCGDGRKIRNQNKNKPKFYYKQFDKVFIFSPSIATQEKPFKLPLEQIYNDYHQLIFHHRFFCLFPNLIDTILFGYKLLNLILVFFYGYYLYNVNRFHVLYLSFQMSVLYHQQYNVVLILKPVSLILLVKQQL